MIQKFLVVMMLIFGLQSMAQAQDTEKVFTIYLVRHAEKELSADNPKDPPLTQCGKQRAMSLEGFLADVDLDAVYSTYTIRTMTTAEPVAGSKGLKPQTYDGKSLQVFARFLLEKKEDALVVGHSNTTAALAGHLIGKELESIDESIYDRIYQVVITKDSAHLNLLHSTFVCAPQIMD